MTDQSYKATASQQILFTEYELHPHNDAYDLAFLFRFVGTIDGERLARAVRTLVDAAPGLRATFTREADGIWVRTVEARSAVTLVTIPEASDMEGWVRSRLELMRADNRIGPQDPHPLQVTLFVGNGQSYMFIRASHLIGDAYSFYQFVTVLGAVYAAPEEAWAEMTADACNFHPGNVPKVDPSPADLATYARLMKGLNTTFHPEIEPVRIKGRILGTNRTIDVDGELAEQIGASWALQDLGAATVFFAAYAAALHRVVDDDTVVLGVPLGNRTGRATRRAFGYFVNTLPLPITIDSQTSWRELCLQVKAGIKLLQRCQSVDLTRSESRALFPDGVFTTTNAVTYYKQGLVLQLPDIEVESLPLSRPSLTYPLTVNIADFGSWYQMEVCLQEGLGDIDFGSLMLEALQHIVGDPDACVVQGWYEESAEAPDSVFDDSTSLVDLIAATVQDNPHGTAVSDGTQELTYEQLWVRADEVAAWLEREEFGPYVVLAAGRSAETVAAILGVLRSGRAYVPIDPSSPPERERLILDRIAEATGRRPRVVVPGTIPSGVQPEGVSAAPVADDLAYVIFTSGSTGQPKGVKIQHGNVVALLRHCVDQYELGRDDRWSLFHSLAFDFSVWEMFGCLASGGTLVIPTAEIVANPAATLTWLERTRVTVLSQTPSGFRRYASEFARGIRLPLVRLLVFGGEPLYAEDLLPWWQNHEATCRAVNMYGITETTVHVTERDMNVADILLRTSVIGDVMGHARMDILDRYGRPCPVGVVGEVLVSGAGVSAGYLGMPEMTRERFQALRTESGLVRAYRSGDLARRTRGGEVVFHGRADRQVQLRGYRIELGEIEAALTRAQGVKAGVVSLERPLDAEPFLVAWVDGVVGERELRAELASRLPAYMVPGRILHIDGIPMNQNGKPDMTLLREHLTALPAPADGEAAEVVAVGHPANRELAWAQEVAAIFETVIGAGRVGLDSRFMEVGGTSMHVMPIFEQVSQLPGGSALEITDLYEFPTPRALAAHLMAQAPAKEEVR